MKRSLCHDPMGRNKLPGPRERNVKPSYSRFGSRADLHTNTENTESTESTDLRGDTKPESGGIHKVRSSAEEAGKEPSNRSGKRDRSYSKVVSRKEPISPIKAMIVGTL